MNKPIVIQGKYLHMYFSYVNSVKSGEYSGCINTDDTQYKDAKKIVVKTNRTCKVYFHSHPPLGNEKEIDHYIQPPSDYDIITFIDDYLAGKMTHMLVFSPDGVYCIYIGKKKDNLLILHDSIPEQDFKDIIKDQASKYLEERDNLMHKHTKRTASKFGHKLSDHANDFFTMVNIDFYNWPKKLDDGLEINSK